MGRLIFNLTDEDLAALERVRMQMGLRSHAETLRALIGRADGGLAMAEPSPLPLPLSPGRASFSHGRSKTVVVPVKRERVTEVDRPMGPPVIAPGSRLKKR